MAESPSELQFEIEKLERKHAEHPEGRFFVPLANAYRKMGDVETAEALLRAGVQRHPDYLSAHIVLGRCLADRGAASEAEEEFRFVLSQDPQNLIALRTLGELAVAEGRTGEAAEWYRELLAVDPMNEDARQALDALSDAPETPEMETEFRSGAGWWEPQPEESAAAPAPEAPAPDSQDEPGDQWAGYGDLPGLRDDAEIPADTGAGSWFQAEEERTGESWFEPGQAEEAAKGVEPEVEGPPAWLQTAGGEAEEAEPLGAADAAETTEPPATLETWYRPTPEIEERPEAAGPAGSIWYPPEPEAPAVPEPVSQGWYEPEPRREPEPAARFSAAPIDDLEDEPAYEEEGPRHSEVVTETIAELYARQGLHDRAASVYRELIRRRGGDPALERRLKEIERQQRAEQEGAAEPAALEAEAAQESVEEDTFADSFSGGFEGEGEEEEEEAPPAVEAEPVPAPPADPASRKVTIASFLTELVAWTPSPATAAGATTLAEPAYADAPAVPAPVPAPEADVADEAADLPDAEPELPAWPDVDSFAAEESDEAAESQEGFLDEPSADEGSLPYLETVSDAGTGYGTGPAEEEPFPWELPGSGSDADEPQAVADEGSVGGGYFDEPEPVEETAAPPPAAEPAPPAAPPVGPRGAAPQEDEDLESFQAWLRSLKR